jgi:hypothetical protein
MTACKSLLFSIFFAVTGDAFLRLNIKFSCTLGERHRGCVDGGRKHTLLHQSNVYSRYLAFSSSRAYLSCSSSCTFPEHERRLCSEIECLIGVEGRDDMRNGRYGELSFLSAMGEAFMLLGTMSAQIRRV